MGGEQWLLCKMNKNKNKESKGKKDDLFFSFLLSNWGVFLLYTVYRNILTTFI